MDYKFSPLALCLLESDRARQESEAGNEQAGTTEREERIMPMNHRLIHGDCLEVLCNSNEHYTCIFADGPDNIGLNYGEYNDKRVNAEYLDWLMECLFAFVHKADIVWFSYNTKWNFDIGGIIQSLLCSCPWLEAKPFIQTFTFGQHNQHDLGNNYRPLLRLRRDDAPLYPDQIRIESWRQKNGDKRADPRGRVPGDVMQFERNCLPIPNLSVQDIERFLKHIHRKGNDECWEWTGYKREGYGRIKINGKLYGATRVMWRLKHGTDPAGEIILHSCDNPSCCNPTHLSLGSDGDNARDMESKGRSLHPRGTNNGLSKLSEEDVIRIYQSIGTKRGIAKKYSISDVTVGNIKSGKTWSHITSKLGASDVFDFPRVTGNSKQRRKWCPTQLHEGLVERCIKLSTLEGQSVLDPFAGTGTTLRVCKRIKRPCTLIEQSLPCCEEIAREHSLEIKGAKESPSRDLPGQKHFEW